MERIAATADQIKNLIQSVQTAWNFNGGARLETEVDQTRDVSQIEVPELVVAGEIEKDGVSQASRRSGELDFSSSSLDRTLPGSPSARLMRLGLGCRMPLTAKSSWIRKGP